MNLAKDKSISELGDTFIRDYDGKYVGLNQTQNIMPLPSQRTHLLS